MKSCGGILIALYSWGCVRWLSKEGDSVCPARTAPRELSRLHTAKATVLHTITNYGCLSLLLMTSISDNVLRAH